MGGVERIGQIPIDQIRLSAAPLTGEQERTQVPFLVTVADQLIKCIQDIFPSCLTRRLCIYQAAAA